MKFEFKRHRIDKIPKEKIIEELRRVARLYNYREFGWREFDKVSKLCKSACVKKNFGGSWTKALRAIGRPLREKSKRRFSDSDLFGEMERIWQLLGHRPSRIEWQFSHPRISYNTYKKYFGGWTKACLKFVEFKMGKNIQMTTQSPPEVRDVPQTLHNKQGKKKRDIPLGLRLAVLKRDDFRCIFCGRSPATEKGVILHIDHVIPVSKGGGTTLKNLQTLCRECNLGKSDKT